jgi:hypothetical protein
MHLKYTSSQMQWLKAVILATWEEAIGRIAA